MRKLLLVFMALATATSSIGAHAQSKTATSVQMDRAVLLVEINQTITKIEEAEIALHRARLQQVGGFVMFTGGFLLTLLSIFAQAHANYVLPVSAGQTALGIGGIIGMFGGGALAVKGVFKVLDSQAGRLANDLATLKAQLKETTAILNERD